MENNKRRKTLKGGLKPTPLEQQVLETKMSDIESEDDLLKAFMLDELHLNFAHSITLGYFNERYYLLFVVGGRNFMWATPTTTRMEPKDLVCDFIAVSGLKTGRISMDNKFTAYTVFKAFCKEHFITSAPPAAYTHTMQACAEGAVKICKEHVCCLLKLSNAPASFWPFSLLHFCCTYNYWPGVHSPQQWETMKNLQFDFNIESNLHPWGCYVVVKLSKEHPLVSENTTHSDRGIKGVFLGWHYSTPTCWICSFSRQCILSMQDVVFNHNNEYPFLDPSCLVTPGILSDDQVVKFTRLT
eukprot:2877675-Rhodomonas_salina.2